MTKKIKMEEIEINEATREIMNRYPVLGKRVKDVVTGVEGTVVSILVNLFGCNQIGVSPGLDKDGKLENTVYIDETRIKVLATAIKGKVPKKKQVRSGADFNPDAPSGF